MESEKSEHQRRIEEFMRRAKQDVPDRPVFNIQDGRLDVALLRARLIYEEACETIKALGCRINRGEVAFDPPVKTLLLPEIVDGLADLSVVTIGSLSAFGVADIPILRLVDENNLAKFGPGHSIREDGKLVKPPDHVPPAFFKELARQFSGKTVVEPEHFDSVQRPRHYVSKTGLEAIDVIEAFDLGFKLGNVVKYVLREKGKAGLEDLMKARWYLDREIKERGSKS